jgi:hypothetical protein
MPTTETLLQSPTIDLIDDADLLWVWNSSASALTKATRASVVGDIDLLFSNASDKQISINNSPAATIGRTLTVKAGDVASGTNLAGGTLDFSAGLGTGTGNSNLIFSTGQSTGSSTSVQVNTERMRITNSGNVGIGTASPIQLLELSKTSNYQLSLRNPGTNGGFWNIGQTDDDMGAGGGKLVFVPNATSSLSAAVTFQSNGNVGIGTTSPSTRLDIDAGALELAEMTAPAAGAANTVRIYAVDNGGRTQLMALFSSGAAQQLAIQPL